MVKNKSQKYEQLSKNSAKLEIKYQKQDKLLKKLETEWKTEKSKLKGRIKILSDATYLIREKARKENRSDLIYDGKTTKYVMNELRFNNGPPIGYVLIFSDGKVVSKIYNHEINVKNIVLRDMKSGKYNIASKANFILKSGSLKKDGKNWYGKPHPLTITGGKAIIDPVEDVKIKTKRLMTWPPKINGNVNFYGNKVKPGVGVSLMGYGISNRDLDWKFLNTGTDYDKEDGLSINFTPVLYRPFKDSLSNTYIGPGVSINKNETRYFIGISIGF